MNDDFHLTRESAHRFRRIDIGAGMEASIQAGEGNYSTPKKNYPSSDQYETFEVALFLFGEFYHPHYNENFINKSWAKHWSEYDEVGAYVPREEVKAMLSDLRKYWSPG